MANNPNSQAKILIKDGIPQNTEGYEGEIRFGNHEGLLYQFVKFKGKWHSTPFSQRVGD